MTLVLELIKTLAAIAVPVIVAVVGYRLTHRLKRWEADEQRNQELIKVRLQYYAQLAPMLNDLMCYLTYVGRWKELTPPQVVRLKRDLDRLFNWVAPLFSEDADRAYRAFLKVCFDSYQGAGTDARIRSTVKWRKDAADDWQPEWDSMFSGRDDTGGAAYEAYQVVVAALIADIRLVHPAGTN